MKFKLSEMKAQRSRDLDVRLTWPEIEAATGVPRNMLIAMDKGSAKQGRPTYIDALAAYFGVGLTELVELEPVALPLPDVRAESLT